MFKTLSIVAGALLAAAIVQAESITNGYSVSNGITGLYTAGGLQTSSTINLNSVACLETYDVTFPTPGQIRYAPIGGVWHTRLEFHFSSSNWQFVDNTTAFGINVCHFVVTTSSGSVSISDPPVAYFVEPVSPPVTYSGSNFSATTDPTVVGHINVFKGDLSVDYSDMTGKTGYIEWDCDNSTPYPWYFVPGAVTVGSSGSSNSYFCGCIWLFVQPGNYGTHSTVSPAWNAYGIPGA